MKGSCLCGKVGFTLKAPLEETIYYCHCTLCQKNYGMYGAFVGVPKEAFKITKGSKLVTWFESSKDIFRGFCSACGSPIAWDKRSIPRMYVPAGVLDAKVKVKKAMHIHTRRKGSYYEICDGHPQYKTVPK